MDGFGEIAESLRRSTVLVQVGGRGYGSGVIWSPDGVIVTNAHVARSASFRVQLWDGREFDAKVVSRDSQRDLAALQIRALGLPAAVIGDSSALRPGEMAVAIGNPFGFVGALTTGVIQGVGPVRGLGAHNWVQASVRLAPGNSGGPLADARGKVIGINTMVAGRVGLAIPSNSVKAFLAGNNGRVLGVTIHPVQVPRPEGGRFGLLLAEVDADGPAASASLMVGDILLGVDGKAFQSIDDLTVLLARNGPPLVRLEFLRGDYSLVRRVAVQLETKPGKRSGMAA